MLVVIGKSVAVIDVKFAWIQQSVVSSVVVPVHDNGEPYTPVGQVK